MTSLRPFARFTAWVVAGLVGGLLAAMVLPLAFGARPYTVLSGSMEPAIAAGDLVVAKRTAPADVRLGDVVTFEDPKRGNRLTTHRVGGIRRSGGKIEFVTKGDANDNTTERWRVPADGELGRVAYRVPSVGNVTVLAGTPLGFALMVAVPLLLLAINELLRIWRPRSGDRVGDARA
jgi:signal peptidase I